GDGAIVRVGLLVEAHQEIREARLDLSLAVAAAVVLHEQSVGERRELAGLARVRRRGLDVRDRRRRLLLAKTTEEPAALLLISFRRRLGGRLCRRRPLVRARGRGALLWRLWLRRGRCPRIGVRR